jgi:hypothetical protein
VVVDILVEIKGFEYIKCVGEVDLPWIGVLCLKTGNRCAAQIKESTCTPDIILYLLLL